MTIIICYSRCWQCQFAEKKRDHPRKAHTWMDDEDIEYRGDKVPSTPEEWTALGEKQPCACWCAKPTVPPRTVREEDEGLTAREMDEERAADEEAARAWAESRQEDDRWF